eukprot:CAMPEP_0176480900 /NCGR_PEP_ID=MMETSP0200_2-20121128/2527_1 /TAXON_ID=947934 /ORGANISM="Chaetoceros sp., Strain GSL56" /LENGTH=720 /DNA_ID=CAMNT_0017877057 /DNA_START=214 /DNA_END=2376 /DNA_ORIENTATION=+
MDDLLDLMGSLTNEVANNSQTLLTLEPQEAPSVSNAYSCIIRENNNGTKHSDFATGSVDPLTKIRIVQRLTSKFDLMDQVAPYQFHTTTILASMNKIQLSDLITHPSNNSEDDSPSGRTCMATMGIVFSNSGTRISKNGRAFSIVTIGDLHTGPTVSIFLFGNAYSKFSTKIQVGCVIAVLGSSIMSGRNGGETRISLSINEINQVMLVGKAMDYGICNGVDIRKNNSSFGEREGTRTVKCKNYVDLRLGCFCKYHQKQQVKNHGSSLATASKIKSKSMTLMQSLKSDAVMRQRAMTSMAHHSSNIQANPMNIVIPGMGPVLAAKGNNLSNGIHRGSQPLGHLSNRGGLGNSKELVNALAQSNFVGSEVDRKLSSSLSRSFRAPKHMQLSNNAMLQKVKEQTNKNIGLKESSTGINNPYVKRDTYTNGTSLKIIPKTFSSKLSQQSNNDVLGNALASTNHQSRSKLSKGNQSSNSGRNDTFVNRKRKLVHMEGMDGQVLVPKPSALFRQSASSEHNSAYRTTPPQLPATISPSLERKEMLMEQQKKLAKMLKGQDKVNGKRNSTTACGSVTSSADLDMILGVAPLSSDQRARILDAKSKFSDEARAESFAKSRQAITELEKKETSHEKRQSRKTKPHTGANASGSAIIILGYKCLTCNKITTQRPSHCITMRHKVKQVRDIKKHERASEKRLKLKSRSPEDGGMILGSGLEWSGWKGRSD